MVNKYQFLLQSTYTMKVDTVEILCSAIPVFGPHQIFLCTISLYLIINVSLHKPLSDCKVTFSPYVTETLHPDTTFYLKPESWEADFFC